MTQTEVNRITQFCKANKLPMPHRRPITGKPGTYLIKFNTNRFRGEFTSYTAAMSLLDEQRSSGWAL